MRYSEHFYVDINAAGGLTSTHMSSKLVCVLIFYLTVRGNEQCYDNACQCALIKPLEILDTRNGYRLKC